MDQITKIMIDRNDKITNIPLNLINSSISIPTNQFDVISSFQIYFDVSSNISKYECIEHIGIIYDGRQLNYIEQDVLKQLCKINKLKFVKILLYDDGTNLYNRYKLHFPVSFAYPKNPKRLTEKKFKSRKIFRSVLIAINNLRFVIKTNNVKNLQVSADVYSLSHQLYDKVYNSLYNTINCFDNEVYHTKILNIKNEFSHKFILKPNYKFIYIDEKFDKIVITMNMINIAIYSYSWLLNRSNGIIEVPLPYYDRFIKDPKHMMMISYIIEIYFHEKTTKDINILCACGNIIIFRERQYIHFV